MSQSIWCDKGKHSFSANDPDKENFQRKRTVQVPTLDNWGHPMNAPRQEMLEELDICGPCGRKEDMFQPAGEIMEAEKESDKSEAQMWKAKYEAEKVRGNTIRIEPE